MKILRLLRISNFCSTGFVIIKNATYSRTCPTATCGIFISAYWYRSEIGNEDMITK